MDATVADDDKLLAALDALGVDDEEEASGYSVPVNPTANELARLIYSANGALGDSIDKIPQLSKGAENVAHVLACSLHAILRLSDSVQANAELRAASEKKLARLQFDLDSAERAMRDARLAERTRSKADSNTVAKARDELARIKQKNNTLKAAADDAKAAATVANNRAAVAETAARKRERELARLQKKVHSNLGGTRRPNFAVDVTLGPAFAAASPRASTKAKKPADTATAFTNAAIEAEVERAKEAEAENFALRETVTAVHHELDALLESFPTVLELERQQQAIMNGEDVYDGPIPAPDALRMLLPYEMLVDQLDEALVTKFKMLRRALCYQELADDVEFTVVEPAKEDVKTEGEAGDGEEVRPSEDEQVEEPENATSTGEESSNSTECLDLASNKDVNDREEQEAEVVPQVENLTSATSIEQ